MARRAPSKHCRRARGRGAFALAAAIAWTLTGPGTVAAQADRPTACHPDRDSRTTVGPTRIMRASTVLVDTRLGFGCAAPIEPLHAVLVPDAGVVAADSGLRAVLADLPARLQPAANPYALLGRIDFGDDARTQCGLTRDADELALCLAGDGAWTPEPGAEPPPATSGPSLADAVRKAVRLLVAARDDDPPSRGQVVRPPRDLVVVVAGAATVPAAAGAAAAWCAAAAPALADAVAAGVEVRVACNDGACAQSCLPRAVATARGDDGGLADFHDATEDLVGRVWATEARVWSLIVREGLYTVPSGERDVPPFPAWTIVPNSLQPPMPHHPDDTVIRWQLRQPMPDTVHLRYMVRPRVERGTVSLRQGAANASLAFVTDTRGGAGVYALDNPSVVVVGWGPFAAFLPLATRDLQYSHSY